MIEATLSCPLTCSNISEYQIRLDSYRTLPLILKAEIWRWHSSAWHYHVWKKCANKMPWVVVSHIFLFQQNIMTIPSQRGFFLHIIKKNPLHLPHLCLHFQFAYQRNPIGTCFAYLHMISNFKWTCQKWSNFLFWMCEDYLACIISASTCNIAKKQNKLISNNTRGTFYIAFH